MILESNFMEAIKQVTSSIHLHPMHKTLAIECQELIAREWQVRTESNCAADSLAKLALMFSHGEYKVWDSPPEAINQVLHQDRCGSRRLRRILQLVD